MRLGDHLDRIRTATAEPPDPLQFVLAALAGEHDPVCKARANRLSIRRAARQLPCNDQSRR